MSTNNLAVSRLPEAHETGDPAGTGGGGAAGSPEARPRILVVDDVADNRDILVRRLVRRGFDAVEASRQPCAWPRSSAELRPGAARHHDARSSAATKC